jgi:hypothetical protein
MTRDIKNTSGALSLYKKIQFFELLVKKKNAPQTFQSRSASQTLKNQNHQSKQGVFQHPIVSVFRHLDTS